MLSNSLIPDKSPGLILATFPLIFSNNSIKYGVNLYKLGFS